MVQRVAVSNPRRVSQRLNNLYLLINQLMYTVFESGNVKAENRQGWTPFIGSALDTVGF